MKKVPIEESTSFRYDKKSNHDFFNRTATKRDKWKKRNSYYHKLIVKQFRFFIPEDSDVIEIGCSTGDLLASLKPKRGVGIDFASNVIDIAKSKYPKLDFIVEHVENLSLSEKFDYVILSDVVGALWDVQVAFEQIMKLCHQRTRVIISYYNFFWEPMVQLSELLGLKQKQPLQNWLSSKDIITLLNNTGYETVKKDNKILLPKNIPLISHFLNKYLVNLPLINQLSLTKFIVARPLGNKLQPTSVSIVIPAKNEMGNIEKAILMTPIFGTMQEFIFVEGGSEDGTYEEMLRVKSKYPDKNIKVYRQTAKGKANAVWEGFEHANGEVLMILDADLTTPPEDLPKFYNAIISGRGEFINGCRLVYPMENEAMRLLNLFANKIFSVFFSFLLGQRVKDTLCGTKVLYNSDYQIIKDNRGYFGDFDPFGDFDLLFGASKMDLKITEIIVRYRQRTYGTTQISRFKHGLILIKMCYWGIRKLKFI